MCRKKRNGLGECLTILCDCVECCLIICSLIQILGRFMNLNLQIQPRFVTKQTQTEGSLNSRLVISISTRHRLK